MKRACISGVAVLLLSLLCLAGRCEQPDGQASRMPAGFVRVTTATEIGWLPLPTEDEYTYPLIQVLPDGSTTQNIIHLLPDGMYMESSTCANQNCVQEGTVTLANRSERILGNAVLCLPNQVSLELFSLDEVLQMTGADLGGGDSR